MKKFTKILASVFLALIFSVIGLCGCVEIPARYVISFEQTSSSGNQTVYTITYSDNTTSTFTVTNGTNGANGTNGRGISSVQKTATENNVDTYTIFYTDGTTSTFTITNGSDGANGANGAKGEPGQDLSISDIYNEYNKTLTDNGKEAITFEQFLEKFLKLNNDYSQTTAKCLLSSLAIYSEFIEDNTSTPFDKNDAIRNVYTGSGVIYRIDQDYSYIITNYHVIYSATTKTTLTDGNCFAQRIVAYMYGHVGFPYETDQADSIGAIVGYTGSPIDLTIVGASINDDIALLRVPTADLKSLNENATAIEFADDYHVGETAIAIGDANSDGIAVSEGIVSVDSEYITLAVDGTNAREHRLMRMDAVIYPGSSGCGLFNKDGKLIGICNSGASEESINYAIPVDVVKPVVENLFYYHTDGNDSTNGFIVTSLGFTIYATTAKYQYDLSTGYGKIVETIIIGEIAKNSVIDRLGLEVDDLLHEYYINGTPYPIDRTFNVYSLAVSLRVGDQVKFSYTRAGVRTQTAPLTISDTDLVVR